MRAHPQPSRAHAGKGQGAVAWPGPQARSHLATLPTYVPGRPNEESPRALLSANENPLGASPGVREALGKMKDWARYPEGSSFELRQAIGRLHGLDPERIICGAGSGELLSLCAQGFAGPGCHVVMSQYGFLMYPLAAQAVGAKIVRVSEVDYGCDSEALLRAAAVERTTLLFLAHPNNPTGSFLPKDTLERLCAALPPRVLLVLDTAYAEYAQDPEYCDGLELVDRFPNLVVTRTFSKVYGLAGLRLGWATARPEVIEVLNRLRGPFNVSLPAQVAGLAALGDQEHIAYSHRHNLDMLAQARGALEAMGLTPPPSQGNFLLLPLPKGAGQARRVRQYLADLGIFLRSMDAYDLPHCLRMTMGSEKEMNLALRELQTALAEN